MAERQRRQRRAAPATATPTRSRAIPTTNSRRLALVGAEAPSGVLANTVEHFEWWAAQLTLDNGAPWLVEDFQLEIVGEVFERYREVVAILPTGSYKTTTFGGLALYHLLFTPGAKVPIGASSKQQATILYEQAAGFIYRSPTGLQPRLEVKDGYKLIRGLKDTAYAGRWMKVYSASDDTGDGVIPTLALIDELHRHKGHDLYGTWRDKLTKTGGTLVTLSTAGDSEDNPLEQLRESARHMRGEVTTDGRHTVARTKPGKGGRGFVMHEWALRPSDDPDDLDIVKMANPAEQVTLEELRMRRDSPSTKLWQWLRFTCNVRAKGEDSAIQPEDLDARCKDGLVIAPTTPVYVGLDIGWKIDHTAIAPIGWASDKRRLIAGVVTLAPPVEEEQIVAAILHLHETLDVRGVVYDPNSGGEQMVQQLERGKHELQLSDEARETYGLPPLARSKVRPLVFVEHSQDTTPMALAAVRFDEALEHGWIEHDGMGKCTTPGCRCGGMRGHFVNAVMKVINGEKWRYDRPSDAQGGKRAKYPIDALTAAVMAHSVAVREFAGSGLNLAHYRISRL